MDAMSLTFSALADPTRRAIIERLARGEASAGELAAPFAISQPAISRHLRILEQAELIERRVEAQRRICRLRPAALAQAAEWIESHRTMWEDGLDRLAALIEDPTPSDPKSPRSHQK